MGTTRVGTRGSRLAIAQAEAAVAMMEAASGRRFELVTIRSGGDLDRVTPLHRMAGQGVFASELQAALLAGEVDVAVHSLKDMPLQIPESAPLAAVPPRGSPADLLLLGEEGDVGEDLPPPGTRIGTSSPRRQSQLLALDRDLVPVDIRGNVDTRLRKLREGWVDALLLAEAAYARLPASHFQGLAMHRLPLEEFPTAPGQGAIAIQTRADGEAAALAARIDDLATRKAVEIERKLLAALGGGCGMPLGMTVRGNGAGWIMDASLAGTDWREEDPPRLARCHLVEEDPEAALQTVLRALGARREPVRDERPVAGRGRVLLVADGETAAAYGPPLRAAGFRVESWYPFAYEPTFGGPIPQSLLDAWEDSSWVLLTSHRASGVLDRLIREAPRKGPQVGVVGPRTARAVRRRGLPVHYVSKSGTAASLARELASLAEGGDRFLHLAAEDAREDLARDLREAGLEVTQHSVYRSRPKPGRGRPGPGPFDAVVVFSPKGAATLVENLRGTVVKDWVAIGPTTATALEERGGGRVRVAERRTPAGVLATLGGPP
ncbi:MAG: hydroxymethylbilane synthase [Thermoplasmata archaeon]